MPVDSASLAGQVHHPLGLAPHVFNADIARLIGAPLLAPVLAPSRAPPGLTEAALPPSLAAMRRRGAGERLGGAEEALLGEAPHDANRDGDGAHDGAPFEEARLKPGGLLRAIRALRDRWVARRARVR